jgi:tetratricopeptide (TPR) repeat protein
METKVLNRSQGDVVGLGRDVAEMCRLAKEFENAGDYEGARAVFAGIWNGPNSRPETSALPEKVKAEVLLRVGALSGWLGSSEQIPEAQEFAKDMISEGLRAYEAVGDDEKVAEAQTDLAICYWREGAMDEARIRFEEALSKARVPQNQLRVLVNATTVEISSNRPADGLAFLDRAATLLDFVEDPATKGRYHMQRAIVLMELGGPENLDRALIENAAARVYFEEANHSRYFARVENNTGIIFQRLGRYDEALEHFEGALRTFAELGDVGTAAQVNEAKARVLIEQGKYVEAEKVALAAAATLEDGGEQSLLAEALEAQGIALARSGRYETALNTLKRAAQVAETAGDPHSAGRIFLTILHEVTPFLGPHDVVDIYVEADRRLDEGMDSETSERLRSGARMLAANTISDKATLLMDGFSLEQEVLKYEGEWIKRALDQALGSVTRAARLLGLTHQGLCYIINTRHKSLMTSRAPVRIRRKSIIKKPKTKTASIGK